MKNNVFLGLIIGVAFFSHFIKAEVFADPKLTPAQIKANTKQYHKSMESLKNADWGKINKKTPDSAIIPKVPKYKPSKGKSQKPKISKKPKAKSPSSISFGNAMKYYNPSFAAPTPGNSDAIKEDAQRQYNKTILEYKQQAGTASPGIDPLPSDQNNAPGEPVWTSGSTLSSLSGKQAGPVWTSGSNNSSSSELSTGSSSPAGPQWLNEEESRKLSDTPAFGTTQTSKAGTPRFIERMYKKTLPKLSREQLSELSTSSTSDKTDSTALDTVARKDASTGMVQDALNSGDFSRRGTPADLSEFSPKDKSQAYFDPDNEFNRSGGRGLTDAEWQSITPAKKTKKTKVELSIEELEKMDCPELSKQAESASSTYTSQCYQLMHKKGCFLNSVNAADGMPQGKARSGADPDVTAPSTYEDPMNKSIAAAIESMKMGEEAASFYEKLGIDPPEPWGQEFLNALAKGIEQREKADQAYVNKIEDIAGMMDGYQGIEQSDGPVSIDFGSSIIGDVKSVNPGGDPDATIELPEIAEKLYGSQGGEVTVSHVVGGTSQHEYGGTIASVFSAQNDTATATVQTWKPGAQPKHRMVNNEGLIWNDDAGQWQGKKLFQAEETSKKEFAQRKQMSQQQRDKDWDDYWKDNADPPLDHEIYEADSALASTKTKWDILDRLWKKKYDQKGSGFNDISIHQIDALEKRMENAIQKGASPEELNGLYKGFVRHHMVETGLMTAANAEEEEITANFYLEQSQNALSAATGTIGFAGVVAEVGAYTLKGYLEGDTKTGLWEAFEMNVPTSTVKFFKDYINDKPGATPTGFIGALLQDALVSYGTFNTVKGLTSGGGWGKKILGEDLTLGGKNIADDAFELLAGKANKIQTSELDMLKARSRGLDKVNRFKGSYAEALTDAKIKGRAFKVEGYPGLRDAGLEIFGDKHAMHMLNDQHNWRLKGNQAGLIEQFDTVMDSIYKKSDKIMKNGLSADYAEILNKKGINFEGLTVNEFKPTNTKVSSDPKLKASYDRDVSATIQYIENITDSNGNVIGRKLREIDVPEEMMHKHLSQGMWESAGKPDIKQFDPHGVSEILYSKPKIDPVTKKPMIDPDTGQVIMIKPSPAEAFMRIHDQAPTWRLSSDAYGHVKFQLDSAITYKSELFLDNMDLGYTTAYKGFEWKESGHKLRIAAKQAMAEGNTAKASYLRSTAQAMEEEGMRQWTKQWKNQMIPGVAAVRSAAAELGIKNLPKGPPPKLAAAIEIMEDTGTLKNGAIVTPETINEQLKLLGYSNGTDDVGKSMQDYMQSMQQYVSGKPKIKTKLADKGWAQRTMDNINMKKKFGPYAPQVDLTDPSKVFRGQQNR